jgi:hypothetical protein
MMKIYLNFCQWIHIYERIKFFICAQNKKVTQKSILLGFNSNANIESEFLLDCFEQWKWHLSECLPISNWNCGSCECFGCQPVSRDQS